MKSKRKILLLGAALLAASAAQGQAGPAYGPSFALTYNTAYAGLTSGNHQFWLNGGGAEIALPLYRGFGVVANVTGMTSSNTGAGAPLTLVTTTFGPRYRWTPSHHSSKMHPISYYGEGLFGAANGFASIFPAPGGATTQAKSIAARVGGGMDVGLTPRISLRAFEASWLHTQLPNATNNSQNDLQLSTGVVLHFSK